MVARLCVPDYINQVTCRKRLVLRTPHESDKYLFHRFFDDAFNVCSRIVFIVRKSHAAHQRADHDKREKQSPFKNIWLGLDCLNILGINNVNSYYWVTDIQNHQYAVPNYLTGRQLNGKVIVEF